MTSATMNVDLKGDASKLLSELGKVQQAVAQVRSASVKSGYKTTEFWMVLLGYVFTAVTLVYHKDFSGYLPALSVLGAALGTMVYTVSRAHLKKPVDLVNVMFDLHALANAGKLVVDPAPVPPVDPAPVPPADPAPVPPADPAPVDPTLVPPADSTP